MGWATKYIEQLSKGETIQFRPRSASMTGKINSGQLVTVEPIKDREIEVGHIVLCKVNGAQYLHLVKATYGERFQIGADASTAGQRGETYLELLRTFPRKFWAAIDKSSPHVEYRNRQLPIHHLSFAPRASVIE